MTIEVGPALATLLSMIVPSLISWLAFRMAAAGKVQSERAAGDQMDANVKVAGDLKEIHTAVNSNNEKLVERLANTERQLLEVSKLLAAAQQVNQGSPAVANRPAVDVHIVGTDLPVPVDVIKKKTADVEN